MTPNHADRYGDFASWVAMNDYLIDCEFLVDDVPGMPEDCLNDHGLDIAEAELLRRFDSTAAALAPHNRHLYDKFVRFVGQAFVTGLGMHWTNRAMVDTGQPYIGVAFAWQAETLEIPTLVTSAIARQTGHLWSFVYRNMQGDLRQHNMTVAPERSQ